MALEKYSVWAKKTRQLEGIPGCNVPVAPSGPGFSRPEQAKDWSTGMENPTAERAMVASLLAWINKVINPFRDHLSAPAQVILDNELLKLMHLGKGKTYEFMTAAADAMCDKLESE